MRFRFFPFGVRWSRRTARSLPAPGHPASALLRPRHPRQEVGSPMRFLAPRVSGALFLRWRRRPRGSFAVDFFRLAYRARTQAVIATSPEPSKSRRRPWDSSVPFAVLLPPAGDGIFQCLAPTCRFATRRREFHRRGVHLIGRPRSVAAAPGVWPRGRTVPCHLPAPL
jgi:hypothetical protein